MKIKFLIITAVLATVILFSGGVVNAADNSALIAQLTAQIQLLLQQIAQLQGQQNPDTSWCYTFNTNMGVGYGGGDMNSASTQKANDVRNLRLALISNGILGANNLLSGNSMSGGITYDGFYAAAVLKFQAKYGISQIGVVGPITRAKLNQLYGCTNSCISEGGTVTGPVAPQYQTVCCSGLIAQYPSNVTGSSGICIRPGNNCPQYSPPAPGWCANGTIVSGGYNSAGCPNPPICSSTGNLPPVISGVTAPTTLSVGQIGTWTVRASDPENGTLSYSFDWGDAPQNAYNVATPFTHPLFDQTMTNTHSYSSSGTYTVTITVMDNAGQTALSSATVQVGNVTQCYTNSDCPQIQCFAYPCPVSVCINGQCVTQTNQFSINVISPNGGETWDKGTAQMIRWQDNTPMPRCPDGARCVAAAPTYYDIRLMPYDFPCTGQVCPLAPARMPYTIAKSVGGLSYNWGIGKVIDIDNSYVSDGSYTIQICQTGTSICDSSDSYFKIVSVPTVNFTASNANGQIFNTDTITVSVGSTVNFVYSSTNATNGCYTYVNSTLMNSNDAGLTQGSTSGNWGSLARFAPTTAVFTVTCSDTSGQQASKSITLNSIY